MPSWVSVWRLWLYCTSASAAPNIVDAYQLRRMIVGPCAMTGLVDW